jgi:hypothetical protein
VYVWWHPPTMSLEIQVFPSKFMNINASNRIKVTCCSGINSYWCIVLRKKMHDIIRNLWKLHSWLNVYLFNQKCTDHVKVWLGIYTMLGLNISTPFNSKYVVFLIHYWLLFEMVNQDSKYSFLLQTNHYHKRVMFATMDLFHIFATF